MAVAQIHQTYDELWAEWLKLKGSLYDPNTGLPTLSAVVEDMRRRIESGETLGLIYLDISGEDHLETICGWEVYERLIRQVAEALLDLKGRLLRTRDTIAVLGIRDDEFILLVGDEATGGLDERRLEDVRNRVVAELTSRLTVEVGGDSPRALGIDSGACLIRVAPTVRIERSIYRSIDDVKAMCRRARDVAQPVRLRDLRRILGARDIQVRYQPIFSLTDGTIHGFEALSRGPQGHVFENPEVLFAFAEQTNLLLELERLCRMEALRGAAKLAPGQKLFVNCSGRSLSDPELVSRQVIELAQSVGLERGGVVAEITERTAITEWHEVRRALARLRKGGCYVAIDDMGSGYSSLKSVAELEPEYLKFDVSLVRGIDQSPIKRNLLETLVGLAAKIGALVVAEGVETDAELQVLRAMGVTLGQGFFLGAPDTLARYLPA